MRAYGWFFLLGPIAIASMLAMLYSLRTGNSQLRRIGHLGAAFVPLAYLAVFVLQPMLAPGMSRRESIRLLTEAAKEGHPESAANGLGIFLKYPDGSWLTIRYQDSHSAPGWSMAVALDSTGDLYVSEHHFCGAFRGYKHMIALRDPDEILRGEHMDQQADDQLKRQNTPEPPRFSGIMDQIHELASAPDLQTAIPLLLRLHFRPLAK